MCLHSDNKLRLDMSQIFYILLTSLNARTSRGLGGFQSANLAESAQVRTTRLRSFFAEPLIQLYINKGQSTL
jgi:hypothetical protein